MQHQEKPVHLTHISPRRENFAVHIMKVRSAGGGERDDEGAEHFRFVPDQPARLHFMCTLSILSISPLENFCVLILTKTKLAVKDVVEIKSFFS